MYRAWLFLILLVSACGLAGCQKAETVEPKPLTIDDLLPKEAQPKLRTLKLWVGAEELITELALTADQERTGMMFRTNMAENEAMLFVFAGPYRASFWMKNTILPLSAAYVDPGGAILEIHDLKPHDTNSVVASSDRVQFVIEAKQGWFERHNVTTGMVVRTEHGSLLDTFSVK